MIWGRSRIVCHQLGSPLIQPGNSVNPPRLGWLKSYPICHKYGNDSNSAYVITHSVCRWARLRKSLRCFGLFADKTFRAEGNHVKRWLACTRIFAAITDYSKFCYTRLFGPRCVNTQKNKNTVILDGRTRWNDRPRMRRIDMFTITCHPLKKVWEMRAPPRKCADLSWHKNDACVSLTPICRFIYIFIYCGTVCV